jgi:hypothetical protein
MLKINTTFALISVLTLSVIHFVSLELFLYWHYLWLDLPMHALGGATIALVVFVPYDFSFKLPSRFKRLVPVLSFVLIAALLWEVYELQIGIPVDESYPIDTISDLFMGLFGGLIGYFVGHKINQLN